VEAISSSRTRIYLLEFHFSEFGLLDLSKEAQFL
jgi:hypothetical protein